MIWEAILKPIAVSPTVGEEHRIRVLANNQEDAVAQVRFHSYFEGCGNYAITSIKEVSK